MRLSLKALRYFLTAVERGGITRAAEHLHVVPSAISAAIDQVEDEFGLKLVMRYPAKGIQPTAAGQLLLSKIRHLLEEYDNLMIEGADLRTALTGTLRVGFYAPIAPAFMPQIIAPLIAQNASVDVKLVECDNETAQDGLLDGRFDVILFTAENLRPGIAFETLIEVPAYVLVAKSSALARHRSLKITDLADHPIVLLDLPVIGDYYRDLLVVAGIAPKVVATATTTEMVRSLVGAGVGCAMLNMRPFTTTSYAGDEVIAIPIKPKVKPLRLGLGHLEGNPRRLVHAFVKECRTYFTSAEARKLVVAR